MHIGLVLQPFCEENLRLAAQLGATDIVCHMPPGDFSNWLCAAAKSPMLACAFQLLKA